jgi:membrane protein YqaA with SNARE-associated domain
LGVFVLAVVDSGGIPLVGGVDALVILVAALDHSKAYTTAAAAALGSIAGSWVLFHLARKGGQQYLHRYTAKGRGARLRAWFLEYGMVTIFVPGFVPVIPLPLKVFILCAGAMEANPVTFTLVLSAARTLRYLFLAWLGTRLGKESLPYLRHHIWDFVLFAAALFGVLYFAIRFIDAKRVSKSLSTGSE